MLLWLGTGLTAAAQTARFRAGDRVCFVGNSITHNGDFHHNVLLYYLTKFPDQSVTFFNAGLAGDVVSGVMKRLDTDVLAHRPTHVVLMLGMNDVDRGLYGPAPSTHADTLRRRQRALAGYRQGMARLVGALLDKRITVILQKPSIYDQTARLDRANNWGVNDALRACGQYLDTLAARHGLTVVDYWSILNRLNTQLQARDPAATLVGTDRVHPGPTGHFVMTYQFLKSTGVPPPGTLTVDARQTDGHPAGVSRVRRTAGGLTFVLTPPSLPFPVRPDQRAALGLVPFEEELNAERLRITHLPRGRYRVSIGGQAVGAFTQTDLATGLILSQLPPNPIHAQAEAVRSVLAELWTREGYLRTLRFVEYHWIFQQVAGADTPSLPTLKARLDSVATAIRANPFFQSQLDPYFAHKPQELTYRRESDQLRAEARQLAQPRPYPITLTRLPEK
jgi:lysophospholipase L1-like esterase